MLEIILIASGAFLAALFCVWVYRIAKSLHDSKFRQIKLAGQEEAMSIGRGAGTIELNATGSNGASNARKPWGW